MSASRMIMQHLIGEDGKRKYTLKEEVDGQCTIGSHPAHFSPDDTNSKYRVLIKKRHGQFITQQPERKL